MYVLFVHVGAHTHTHISRINSVLRYTRHRSIIIIVMHIIIVASAERPLNVIERFAFGFGHRTPHKYRTNNSERCKYEKRFARTNTLGHNGKFFGDQK